MLKNKAVIVFSAIFIALIASKAAAFTDVKSGSVSISEGGGEGSSTSLNNLVAWLDNPDVATSGEYTGWRGEYQQKLLRTLLENLGGSAKYPQLVAFLSNKFSAGDWDWYYGGGSGGGSFIAATPSVCPKQEVTSAYYTNFGVSFPITVCKYGLLTALEERSSATEVSELRQWLNDNQPELGQFLDSKYSTQDSLKIYDSSCSLACNQENKYNYTFKYSTNKNTDWSLCSDNDFDLENKTYKAQKCENIKMTFSPQAEWFSTLNSRCASGKNYQISFLSPPTPFIDCANKNSCLSQAQEYNMNDGSLAKGVQQVPTDFIAKTESSLSSNDSTHFPCTNNICTPNTSGDYSLSTTAPESSYFGQCRGSGLVITPEGANIPAVKSSIKVNVINQAPVPVVCFSKESIEANEEITATCDIVDPDECSDKIARVKWSCKDSSGNSNACLFLKTDQWTASSITKDIVSSEQSNPYQSVVKFKVSKSGTYAVTCEATDNDDHNPLTGTAVNSISSNSCGSDGICNEACPYDPDCCVDPYCLPYCPGYGNPSCVIPAGSCIVTRTKPELNVNKVKLLEEVDYLASVLGGNNPIGYNWYCDKNSSNLTNHSSSEREDKQICNYSDEGNYEPKVSYQYKDEKGIIRTQDCVNVQGVGVEVSKEIGQGEKSATACNISANSLEIKKGNFVKLELKTTPDDANLSGLTVTWTVDGKITVLKGDKPLNLQMTKAGSTLIEAKIKNTNGIEISCSSTSIEVKDTVKWSP